MRSRPEIIRFHSCAKAGTAYSGRSRKILLRPHPNIPGAMKRCSASPQKTRPIHRRPLRRELKEPCWFRPYRHRRHTDNRRSLQKRTSATRRRGSTGRATAQKVGTGLCFRGSYQDEPPHSHCLQIAIIPFKISIRTGGRKIPPAGSYFYEKCFLNLSQPVFLRVSTALLARNLSNVENKS